MLSLKEKERLVKEIASAEEYGIAEIRDLAAELFEEINDHQLAGAMWAMSWGDYGLAKDFIDLEAKVTKARELTPELRKVADRLWDRLNKVRG